LIVDNLYLYAYHTLRSKLHLELEMTTELKIKTASDRESTKSENLTEYLIEAIVKGELPPGSKISEPELAKRFEVSRGPLREALMRLEGLGLIERIPHVGARVIELTTERLIELYSVREALEGMAARLAAKNITRQELSAINTLLSAHADHINDGSGNAYLRQYGDFDFHYRIIKATRNQKLISLLCDELYQLLRMFRYQSPRAITQPQEALREHQNILRAIGDGDEELAELLMRRHISSSRRLIESNLYPHNSTMSVSGQ
jgi:DNA-binding GntR family transcriptional regulator